MSAIPEVVADPTDDGTLKSNIEQPTTRDHFEAANCPDFRPTILLLLEQQLRWAGNPYNNYDSYDPTDPSAEVRTSAGRQYSYQHKDIYRSHTRSTAGMQ